MIVKRDRPEVSVSSGTAYCYSPFATSTSTGEERTTIVSADAALAPSVEPSDKVVARAIQNYLRFLRARGRVVVGAEEVARALSLSVSQVERIAARLRGVKVEG